jgi:large conductance mechanosensitive channel
MQERRSVMKKFFTEFKEFISKGNVLDMAVGIIIGSAFTAIVTSLVNDLLMPLVGILCNGIDIADLSVTVGSATLMYGSFLQAVINFLIIAFVIFCLVKAINTMKEKAMKKKGEEEAAEEPAPDPQIELLTQIRDLLEKQEKK